jgi:hypothetical protein
VTFETVDGQLYYIYVFGRTTSNTGIFIVDLVESDTNAPQL